MGERDFIWVRDAEGLVEMAVELADAPAHALDTEANSGFAYEERLCLLQLHAAGRTWLVDLLELPGGGAALDALRPLLEGEVPTTYLHGGEFDVGCLKRDFDLALGGVWDSQQAATFLGWEKTGYGALVERVCGVQLAKGHAHFDWARRPIAGAALRYAVEDVLYLPRVCEALRLEVRDADLEEEVAIANRVVMEATWGGGYSEDGFWRIKGVGRLPREALPTLVALYRWREDEARQADMPPGRILNNRQLLAVARSRPSGRAALSRLGLDRRLLERRGGDVLAVVKGAREDPPEVPPRPPGPARDPRAARRDEALRGWRRGEARRRRVPEQAVLPAAALRHLAEHGAGDLGSVPQLGAKRIRLYGERLTDLCTA